MSFTEIVNNGIIRMYFGTVIEGHNELGEEIKYFNISWSILIPTLILAILIAYLLGSINFAIVISKAKFGQDIRDYGSNNAGMTNMMRTYGKKWAALTLIGDILKAVLAVFIGAFLAGQTGAYIAGVGCIIGHTKPLYYNFKGGKGVASAIAVILCTCPVVGVILLFVFVMIVAATKYISLGSVMCALLYPLFVSRLSKLGIIETVCTFIITFMIVFNHRSNIKRLLNGNENKFKFKKSK